MTDANGNGWRAKALTVAGALLLLCAGWIGNGLISDHQRILELERRVAVLEAVRK